MKYTLIDSRVYWPNSVPVPEGVTPNVLALVDGKYVKATPQHLMHEGSLWCFPNVPQSFAGYLGSHHKDAPTYLRKVWTLYNTKGYPNLQQVYADKDAAVFECLRLRHTLNQNVVPCAAYALNYEGKTHVVRMKDVKVIE